MLHQPELPLDGSNARYSQTFVVDSEVVERRLRLDGIEHSSVLPVSSENASPAKVYFRSFLDNWNLNRSPEQWSRRVTCIDLFSGGGGLSLGLNSAMTQIGLQPVLLAAADKDPYALEVLKRNFNPLVTLNGDISGMVKYSLDYSGEHDQFLTFPKIVEPRLEQFSGKVDLLYGGPPCQGHSNLNNKTRHNDERNLLYFCMPAYAVALNAKVVIVENVPTIKKSKENVVDITKKLLKKYDYFVEEIIIDSANFGVAQNRKRHFLIASKKELSSLHSIVSEFVVEKISFSEMNDSLKRLPDLENVFVDNGKISEENIERIKYLHDEGLYNLPNQQRPVCHQNGTTYSAVYGRIFPDEPAGTVTTGLGSPGRGRFIHPKEPRMINLREAARLQGFPDSYWNVCQGLDNKRNYLSKLIGDAVPAPMVHPLIFALSDHL